MYGHVHTAWQNRLFLMEYLIEFYIIKVENINFYEDTRFLLSALRVSQKAAKRELNFFYDESSFGSCAWEIF